MILTEDSYQRALDFIESCHSTGIEDEETLHLYVKLALGFDIPKQALCPEHTAPFEFVTDVFFERINSAIVFANRTGGKTRLSSIINWLDMVFKPKCEITHAGSVVKQAKMAYGYLLEYVEKPWYKSIIDGKPVQERTKLKNGSSISIITASMEGFNGPHPNLCMSGEIMILTPQGYLPLKSFDKKTEIYKVMAYNKRLNKLVERMAIRFDAGDKPPVSIHLSDGTVLSGFSPDHKFLAIPKGFSEHFSRRVAAKDLKGMMLIQADGALTQVKDVRARVSGLIEMYDLSIITNDDDERYFIAGGVVTSNSNVDEVELITWELLQEAFSMSMTKNGIQGLDVLYSTRKRLGGTMDKLLKAAKELGFKIYNWCIFDVLQPCKLTYECIKCPAGKHCIDTEYNPTHGRARFSKGYYSPADFVKKTALLDENTFQAQWACKKPSTEGLFYKEFDRSTHTINIKGFCDRYGILYEPGKKPKEVVPKDWPRFITFDWGHSNPTAWVDFAWDKTNDIVYALREYYISFRDAIDHAHAFIGEEPDPDKPGHYRKNSRLEDWSDVKYWFMNGDPAGATYISTFRRAEIIPTWDKYQKGIMIHRAYNDKEFGYDSMRNRMALKGPEKQSGLIFFDNCVHCIEEHEQLHYPDIKEGKTPSEYPEEIDDHTTDLTRYAIARLEMFLLKTKKVTHVQTAVIGGE